MDKVNLAEVAISSLFDRIIKTGSRLWQGEYGGTFILNDGKLFNIKMDDINGDASLSIRHPAYNDWNLLGKFNIANPKFFDDVVEVINSYGG